MLAAPFASAGGIVLPEWVDANFHMNLAYYLVLCDHGSVALFEALDVGAAYRAAAGSNAFAVETHLVYERELLAGDEVRVVTTLLGVDAKRLHLAHELLRADGARACVQELMFVNVAMASRRAVAWTPPALARLQAACAVHAKLPRPEKLGRGITPL